MRLPRNFTNIFNWIFDNLFPPFLRDSKLLFKPFFMLLFGEKYHFFMDFKKNVLNLNNEQIIEYYKNLSDVHIQRETDLNTASINFILNNIQGNTVLDISCGRGFLAKEIVERYHIETTGVDFVINDNLKDSINPAFLEGNIEHIPFPDNHFDTVISAHTLEHVVNIQQAVKELRRVCKKQLIIVLPKQREYKFTFDLHIHFFPYEHSVLNLMKNKNGECLCLKNDWVYLERV